MIPCHPSLRHVVAVIHMFLLQLALGLALPTVDQDPTTQVGTRDSTHKIRRGPHSRRDFDESDIKKLAGGAVAIVVFGLICGLGSASIAVFGSVEWDNFRRQRKEKKQEKRPEEGKEESIDSNTEEKSK